MSDTPNTNTSDQYNNLLSPIEIDYVFKMDFAEILGVDIWSMLLDIDMMKRHPTYQLLDNPLSAEIRDIVQENVSELISTYFNYQPTKFPNPQDQYKWIVDSELEIRAILGRGIDVPFDTKVKDDGELEYEGEPLKHYQNACLQQRFSKLFEHLVKVGETHKFSRELIAFRKDTEESNEEEAED